MVHSFPEHELQKKLSIEETLSENTCIVIENTETNDEQFYYLNPKELEQFIGILLHIQAKKRKQYKRK